MSHYRSFKALSELVRGGTLVMLLVFSSACYVGNSDSNDRWIYGASDSPRLDRSDASFAAAMKVLGPNCFSCHGNYSKFMSSAEWVASGFVTPRDPANSLLFKALKGNGLAGSLATMPRRGQLSPEQIETLRTWILGISAPAIAQPLPEESSVNVPEPRFISTNPASPSKSSATPLVVRVLGSIGVASTGSFVNIVKLFKDDKCTLAIGSGTPAEFAYPGIQVTLSTNADTPIYGQGLLASGQKSPCSARLTTFIHDNIPPAPPMLSTTVPVATTQVTASQDTSPEIRGSSAPSDAATLRIYKAAGCAGAVVAEGTIAEFLSPGITVGVEPVATTVFSVAAVDAAGNATCSANSLTYVSAAQNVPASPQVLTIAPVATSANPSNNRTPTLTGVAPRNGSLVTTSVRLYRDAACSSAQEVGSTASINATTQAWSITLSAALDTATNVDRDIEIYGKAYAGSAQSACVKLTGSVAAVPAYRLDTIAPTAPVFSQLSPLAPFSTTTPKVIGTSSSADAKTVQLFINANCSGTASASGAVAQFMNASQGITLNLAGTAANANVTFSGRIVDNAGNASSCSGEMNSFVFNPDAAKRLAMVNAFIKSTSCNFCHATDRTDSMNFVKETDRDWQLALSTALTSPPNRPLVVAGNPAASVLYQRLAGNDVPGSIANMPKRESPLNASEVNLVRYWITHMTPVVVPSPVVPDTGPTCTPQVATAARLVRLRIRELSNTLSSLFGVTIQVSSALSADQKRDTFDNDSDLLGVTPEFLDKWLEQLDLTIAANGSRLLANYPCTGSADTCRNNFISKFGKLALRRPLTTAEITDYTAVYTEATRNGGTYTSGALAVAQALLVSPDFLYRTELGTMTSTTARGTVVSLTQYELASFLSYTLLASPPDAQLMVLADASGLDAAEIDRQVTRLLALASAPDAFSDFIAQLLWADHIESAGSSSPGLTSTIRSKMRKELNTFSAEIFKDKASTYKDLLTKKATYVDSSLASYYGIAGVQNDSAFHAATYPDPNRVGVLSLGGIMVSLSRATSETSPTKRGHMVRQSLLCDAIPPPPAGVPGPPPASRGSTTRERLELTHLVRPECASCHVKMDPIGFAFEAFDYTGLTRTQDNGVAIDASWKIHEIENEPSGSTYPAFVDQLSKLNQANQCFVSQWLTYTERRPMTINDSCRLSQYSSSFAQKSGKIDEIFSMWIHSSQTIQRVVK